MSGGVFNGFASLTEISGLTTRCINLSGSEGVIVTCERDDTK